MSSGSPERVRLPPSSLTPSATCLRLESGPTASGRYTLSAGRLFCLRITRLVEEIDETIHGLGVLDLVREVAVDAAKVVEAEVQGES